MGVIAMYEATEKPASLVQPEPAHPRSGILIRVVLIVLALIIIGGSSFLVFDATNLHPKELSAQATAVVKTILTSQAQATTANTPQFLYTHLTNRAPTLNYSSDATIKDWDIGTQGNNSCLFTNGAYHVHVANNQNLFFCLDGGGGSYNDFVFQTQMTMLNATTGGMRFRAASQGSTAYTFNVNSNGIYYASVIQDNPPVDKILLFGRSTAMQPGSQPNLLTVIAHGTHFLYYINKQFVGGFDDNTLKTGLISLFAVNIRHSNGIDVAFNNTQLWVL